MVMKHVTASEVRSFALSAEHADACARGHFQTQTSQNDNGWTSQSISVVMEILPQHSC